MNQEQTYTEFFRCAACARFYEMTEFLKKQRSKCWCGAGKFIPARLSWFEVVRYLLSHPAVLLATLASKLSR